MYVFVQVLRETCSKKLTKINRNSSQLNPFFSGVYDLLIFHSWDWVAFAPLDGTNNIILMIMLLTSASGANVLTEQQNNIATYIRDISKSRCFKQCNVCKSSNITSLGNKTCYKMTFTFHTIWMPIQPIQLYRPKALAQQIPFCLEHPNRKHSVCSVNMFLRSLLQPKFVNRGVLNIFSLHPQKFLAYIFFQEWAEEMLCVSWQLLLNAHWE